MRLCSFLVCIIISIAYVYSSWNIFQFLLVIPVEFLRWTIIMITGAASAAFVASNLKSYVVGNDLTIVLAAAFVLQVALAIFIKMMFFP